MQQCCNFNKSETSNTWEKMVESAWERKLGLVCTSLMLNEWDLRVLYLG